MRDEDRDEDDDVADEVAEVADLEVNVVFMTQGQFEQAGVGDGYTECDWRMCLGIRIAQSGRRARVGERARR